MRLYRTHARADVVGNGDLAAHVHPPVPGAKVEYIEWRRTVVLVTWSVPDQEAK